jgi:phage terminase large subunit GpA-like protein
MTIPATGPSTPTRSFVPLESRRAITRRAYIWPVYYRPAQWAEQYRILTSKESSYPGNWSNEKSPTMVGPMNAFALPWVRRMTWLKPPQVGASEIVRNILGCVVDQDPGPAMFIMPNEDLAKELIRRRLIPLFERTPRLQRYLTGRGHDLATAAIELVNMNIKIGWATSAASLSSVPVRYMFLDEVDLYPDSLGEEVSPTVLAEARTRTYRDICKILELSKPTNQYGPIARALEECPMVFRLWVPCPACHGLQLLDWRHVRGDCDAPTKAERAARVESERLAYYECKHCQVKIHEIQRASMVAAGIWWPGTLEDALKFGNPDPSIRQIEDGFELGLWPKFPHIGFMMPGLASPWVSLHHMRAKGIMAVGDRLEMMAFTNNILGEIFYEDQIESVKASVLTVKTEAADVPVAGVVPRWAQALICTVDTQQDHFWYTVRAWGYAYRSQLVAHGRVATFEEVLKVGAQAQYPREARPGGAGMVETMTPYFTLIDSGGGESADGFNGSRTNEVYQFTRTNSRQLIPVKGHPGGRAARAPFYFSRIDYSPRTAGVQGQVAFQINLMLIDVNFYKSVLSNRMRKDATEPDYWGLNKGVGRDYIRQMSSEHRILDPKTGSATWKKISQSVENHFWDCEVYQTAAADMAQVNLFKPLNDAQPLAASQPQGGYKFREGGASRGGGWRIGR